MPNERSRLYFLLAWFHATVQERLRYAPLGWSKRYEFNESDLRCACDTIDIWIDLVAMVSVFSDDRVCALTLIVGFNYYHFVSCYRRYAL